MWPPTRQPPSHSGKLFRRGRRHADDVAQGVIKRFLLARALGDERCLGGPRQPGRNRGDADLRGRRRQWSGAIDLQRKGPASRFWQIVSRMSDERRNYAHPSKQLLPM